MKDKKNIIIVVLLILVLGMGGYLIYDHIIVKDKAEVNTEDTVKKEEEKQEIEQEESPVEEQEEAPTLTKEEALAMITEIYRNAYVAVEEGSGFINRDTNKFDSSKVQSFFTKRLLYQIERRFQSSDIGEWNTFINSMVPTIFGATDQTMRPLSIIDYSDELIIAEGKVTIDCSTCPPGLFCSCPNDKYAHVITFRKENGTWLIDYFD